MRHRAIAGVLIAIIVLLIASQCMMIVPQGHAGVVLRFQHVVRSGLAPGLHFKLPLLDHALNLDDGWIMLDGQRENGGLEKISTRDAGPLELGYVLLWRINDAPTFCKLDPGCDESRGAYHINELVLSLFRQNFLAHNANDVLSMPLGKTRDEMLKTLNEQLKKSGTQVQSVQVTALGLTTTAQDIVYAQMRSAQSAQAAKLRAQGTADADRIKAEADKQRATLFAKAEVQAQQIRGAADAEAARIYAAASRQDRAFFRFYLGLESYRRAMQNGNNVIVLGPDSQFLKYLQAAVHH